jgi:hypothetical protein
MLDSNPSTLPMSPAYYRDVDTASPSDKSPFSSNDDQETFRAILGSVNFLRKCTRPDLAYAINIISRHKTAPLKTHIKQLKPSYFT